MFGKKVFLISGVRSPEELVSKIREILPIGWRQPYAGGDKTLEELVFGPEAAGMLFDQTLVPDGCAAGTLAISFAQIDGFRLGERVPTWIRHAIEKAVEKLGGRIITKTIR
jgi:hypothetical protein